MNLTEFNARDGIAPTFVGEFNDDEIGEVCALTGTFAASDCSAGGLFCAKGIPCKNQPTRSAITSTKPNTNRRFLSEVKCILSHLSGKLFTKTFNPSRNFIALVC